MKKISLVEKMKMLAAGKHPNWTNVGDFERLALNEGYVASNARRRAQELRQLGIFERRLNGRAAEYKIASAYINPPAYTPEKIAEFRKLKTRLL